jgi:hypothetical protein
MVLPAAPIETGAPATSDAACPVFTPHVPQLIIHLPLSRFDFRPLYGISGISVPKSRLAKTLVKLASVGQFMGIQLGHFMVTVQHHRVCLYNARLAHFR